MSCQSARALKAAGFLAEYHKIQQISRRDITGEHSAAVILKTGHVSDDCVIISAQMCRKGDRFALWLPF